MPPLSPRKGWLLAMFVALSLATPALADPVEVEVNGVTGDALKNVEQALVLPYGLVREGKVDRLWLDRFAKQADEKVRLALEPFGYYHSKVSTDIRETKKEEYRLQVNVEPGPAVRLTAVSVTVSGAGKDQREIKELVRTFPLRPGDILLQTVYEREKSALKSRAVGLGYLDADFTRHEIRIAPGEVAATITLVLETGERYRFGETTIEGGTDFPEPYLRRFIAFQRGELFSFSKIGETQLNFSNSERFKEVLITPEKEKAKNHEVPVLVKLVSAPRRSIRPGIGYGTDTGGRFSVHFRDLNLFHKGQEFDSTLYAAQNLQGFAARYTIPSARDIKGSKAFLLNLQQEDVTTYVSQLAALEFDYNHSLGTGELATPYIRVQEERYTIGGVTSGSRLVLPGFRFTRERFDNLIRPTIGYRYALDLRGAHPYFGSDSALVQFIADGNAVLPLPWRLSLHVKSRVGLSQLADPLADFPPSIRFFAGGDQSVRGYSYQSLGPKNAQGEVVGGRDLVTGTVEIERALFEKWGVSLFHDAGNAFNDLSNVRLAQGAGIGLHYYTPVGGLNLSLAKRLGTSREVYYIHFTVGFQL
ncbi:outer membrane protein assembly factor [Geomonas sp. Red276]